MASVEMKDYDDVTTTNTTTTPINGYDDEGNDKEAKGDTNGIANEAGSELQPLPRSWCNRAWQFFLAYDFPILLLAGIGLAKAYPELGAVYLEPKYTATWIAVALIFFISGTGLQTSAFALALKNFQFNASVQLFNFGVVSVIVFGVSRVLKSTGALSPYLADGLAATGCLSMSINAVSILTVASHGDEATAIFNETFGNMIGIFLSPLLIRGYLGRTGDASLPTIFWKLSVRVLIPLLLGLTLRHCWKAFADFRDMWKKAFVRTNKYLLVFIVYTIFCKTFKKNAGTGLADVFTLILVLFILQLSLFTVVWYLGKILFRNHPKLRVVGLFGCVAKTISLGIPLIGSLYEGNPRVGVYTLPILIWHPMLLVLGSCLTSRLAKFVDGELERLDTNNTAESSDHEEKNGTGSDDVVIKVASMRNSSKGLDNDVEAQGHVGSKCSAD